MKMSNRILLMEKMINEAIEKSKTNKSRYGWSKTYYGIHCEVVPDNKSKKLRRIIWYKDIFYFDPSITEWQRGKKSVRTSKLEALKILNEGTEI